MARSIIFQIEINQVPYQVYNSLIYLLYPFAIGGKIYEMTRRQYVINLSIAYEYDTPAPKLWVSKATPFYLLVYVTCQSENLGFVKKYLFETNWGGI